MRLRRSLLLATAMLPLACMSGCGRPAPSGDTAQIGRHHSHPPHGGTPVILGNDEYNIELVLDPTTGTLQAYVFDDEFEEFTRSSAPSIAIAATLGGTTRELVLSAVPNPETGETVGDTALFEAQADWLRNATRFDGVLRSITIRGSTFTDVKFSFPKGSESDG